MPTGRRNRACEPGPSTNPSAPETPARVDTESPSASRRPVAQRWPRTYRREASAKDRAAEQVAGHPLDPHVGDVFACEPVGPLHDAGGEDEASRWRGVDRRVVPSSPGAPESKLATGDSARDCTPVGDGASGKMRSDSYPTSQRDQSRRPSPPCLRTPRGAAAHDPGDIGELPPVVITRAASAPARPRPDRASVW